MQIFLNYFSLGGLMTSKAQTGLNLTPKQERFCQLYIELGNASEAYRQSYDADSMAEPTVNTKASELLF